MKIVHTQRRNAAIEGADTFYQQRKHWKRNEERKNRTVEKYINKIIHADSYDFIKSIPDKSIDCIYTDVPYLYVNGGVGHSELCVRTARKKKELEDISKGIDYSILEEFKRVLKKVNIFIWCSKMQLLDIMKWGGLQY